MAAYKEYERIVPCVFVGCLVGLAAGLIAERVLPKWRARYWAYAVFALIVSWLVGVGMPPLLVY